MAGDDVTIVITAHNGDAVRAFRDTEGRLRDMRGRFIAEGHQMSGAMNRVAASIGGVRGSLIPLATAAAPLGAALTPIAVKAGAAGVAVAAFGAAVAGQVSYLTDATDAQDKYTQAVTQYGRGSKQAAEAQRAVQASFAAMPQATARAAVGLSTLKDEFKGWSDGLAQFTMVPVERSFALMGQMLPKLTPMVEESSLQFSRLVAVAGGAMATPGFDALTDKFATFANSALKSAVDGIIHFSRALSEGNASGPLKAFMEYAEKNGPALRETLSNMSDAVSTLVEAAANAGPGMLTLVNAAANLVASMPPELVTVLMQTAVALKLVSTAGAGVAAVAGGVQTLATRIAALHATSVAAGGGLAGLKAAFLSLGTAAKASIVVAGIAAVVVAFGKLGEIGREAPPNIDKLTTSLGQLGRTGKASGEAARLFGDDLNGLYDAVRSVSDPATVDKVQQGLVKVLSLGFADSTPVKEAKDRLDGIDEGLTNLVRGGKADIAAAAFKRLSKEYVDGGGKAKDFASAMDGYQSILADAKFEQDLTADSMGVFGAAAQATSAKLEAQKSAADGLRASILALNDANRSAYDAQIGFEDALDSLSEAFEKNGATLDIDTEKGRANGQAMSQAAKARDELIASGLAAGDSLGSMTKKSDELRESMLKLATEAFDGNKKKAQEYVNTLLGTPSEITTLIKAEKDEAIAGLQEVRSAIQATPDSAEVTVTTLNAAAIKALEAVGLKTEQLPDGRTRVYTANGQSLGALGAVSSAMNNLDGKTATTYVKTVYEKAYQTFRQGERDSINKKAAGGPIIGGSGTKDDVPLLAMGGEFIINKKQTQKYYSLLQAINDDRLPKFAKGGAVGSAARGAKDEIRAATSGGTETRLLHLMDAISSGHIKLATALKQVSAELTKAKDSLSSLRSAASQLSGSVRSGVLSASSITNGANGNGPTTLQSITSGLIASRDKATAFSGALGRLKSMGLRADLIQQIAEAGIGGGGLETAGALMGASSSEIQTVNSLQSQIASAAKTAGQTTANAVYGATIKAQEKLVTALDGLTKALKTATGKKATGKKAAGGIVGAAATGGIRSGLTWVGEQEPELLDLPSGSRVWSGPDSRRKAAAPWASMLNSPRRAPSRGAVAAAGPQGPVPVVLEIRAGDSGRYTEFLVQELRRAVKANGSIEATLKPPRGR